MKAIVMLTGMFRSGTTLSGRILNAHKDINFGSDFIQPLFKELRNARADYLKIEVDPAAPLDDYYFDIGQQKILNDLQNIVTLDLSYNQINIERLRKNLYNYTLPNAEKLAPFVKLVGGDTFRSLFEDLMAKVDSVYGRKDAPLTGFKSIFTDEFIPVMARSYPEAYIIQIIRDPRAVCASRNQRPQKNDWIYLARQWRKSAALAWHYSNLDELKHRYLLIYYEDLVLNFEETVSKLCKMLELPITKEILDPTTYVDGSGKAWTQNTAYKDCGVRGVDTEAIDRWRNVLSDDEVNLIECLCGPEMALHGYLGAVPQITPKLSLYPPRYELELLAPWEQVFRKADDLSLSIEMQKERLREDMIGMNMHYSAKLVKGAFLFDDVFTAIKQKLNGKN
ncbi:MAG: sulfotransferase [Desulfobacterales bacterium]|nr:sulfotransferase [Desulfobacterales bacterium]